MVGILLKVIFVDAHLLPNNYACHFYTDGNGTSDSVVLPVVGLDLDEAPEKLKPRNHVESVLSCQILLILFG